MIKVNNNPTDAIKALLRMLDVKISDTSISKIKYRSDYPSLNALSDSLFEWNIGNVAIKIEPGLLNEIPYPAIGHLKKNRGHYVVLQKVREGKICYLDPDIGNVEESILDFEKHSTGVVLLLEANEYSGEKDFEEKKRQDAITKYNKALAAFFLLGLSSPALILPIPTAAFYLLGMIGLISSIALLQKQFGIESIVSSVCNAGGKSDCDAVINSKYSRLFGLIHLSEVGVLYFFGTAILIVLSALNSKSFPSALLVTSLLAQPAVFASVLYQWKVIKKWCPLCLFIMGALFLQFVLLLIVSPQVLFSWQELWLALSSFMLPAVFWLLIRGRYTASFELEKAEKRLYNFTKNERVFQALLDTQPEVKIGIFNKELKIGFDSAPIKIIVVSNPNCGPCFSAHKTIKDLAGQLKDEIQIIYRFLIPEGDSMANEACSCIIGNLHYGDIGSAQNALSEWYSQQLTPMEWFQKYAIASHADKAEIQKAIYEHSKWSADAGINSTPAIIINNKLMPDEFLPADLPFQIRKLRQRQR